MYAISVSYKTASVDIRKIFAFNEPEQVRFIKTAVENISITQCVMLSTCNRMEVYFEGTANSVDVMQKMLCDAKNINIEKVIKYFNVYCKEKAIEHLFKVAGGIDSMLLGEDEILGQVKNAYALALEGGTTGFMLNTVFKQAITAAKKAKTQTGISKTPVSIGTLAAKQVFDLNLEEKNVLLIGVSGKMGTVVAKNLLAKPNIKVLGTLRRHKARDTLEARYENLSYVPYEDRYKYIDAADVIISATSSPHYTVTLEEFEKTQNNREKKFFMDLAVPPDIDKRIGEFKNVTLFDIDYFETLAAENNIQKLKEAESAREVLNHGFEDTLKELAFHDFLPKLPLIKEYFAENDIESAIYKIKKNSDREQLLAVMNALEQLTEVK